MNKGIKLASGECVRCEGPLVTINRNPNALLCAGCLHRPGLCACVVRKAV